MGKALKIFCVILALFVVGFGVVFLVKYNGENAPIRTVSVVDENGLILLVEDTRQFQSGKTHLFKVVNYFGNEEDFTVSVLPANGKDFTFTVDGQECSFASEMDLSEGFDIEKTKDGFSISPPTGEGVKAVLEKIYNGHTVELNNDIDDTELYFTLVLTFENASYRINFNLLSDVVVGGIILSPSEITF